jgi:hypothetical protein
MSKPKDSDDASFGESAVRNFEDVALPGVVLDDGAAEILMRMKGVSVEDIASLDYLRVKGNAPEDVESEGSLGSVEATKIGSPSFPTHDSIRHHYQKAKEELETTKKYFEQLNYDFEGELVLEPGDEWELLSEIYDEEGVVFDFFDLEFSGREEERKYFNLEEKGLIEEMPKQSYDEKTRYRIVPDARPYLE